jgi:hypothetical protein
VLFSTKSDFGSFFLAAVVSLAINDDSPLGWTCRNFCFGLPTKRTPETDGTGSHSGYVQVTFTSASQIKATVEGLLPYGGSAHYEYAAVL